MFADQQLQQETTDGQQNLPTFQPHSSASLSTAPQVFSSLASWNISQQATDAALYRGGTYFVCNCRL